MPQLPLLGHGSEIETPDWAYGEFRPRKENFKISKPHQGGQVPPAIAACYHQDHLLPLRAWVLSRSRHIYLIDVSILVVESKYIETEPYSYFKDVKCNKRGPPNFAECGLRRRAVAVADVHYINTTHQQVIQGVHYYLS